MRKLSLCFGLSMCICGPWAHAQKPEWPSHAEYMARQQEKNQPAATPPQVAEPLTEPVPPAATGGSSYLVQLGAFAERATAERAIRAHGMNGIKISTSERDDRTWYVLQLGPYAARADAEEASRIYLQANPSGSTWIRRIPTMEAME